MFFAVRIAMVVDAIDDTQTELIALAALQAAKAEVNRAAAEVVDSDVEVGALEE